ncbi:MAG: restriction endonuclease [Rhodobacteraceae bacterium]|nr:restriction endonuclease [Paracoccaceae bacterium]
MSFIKKAILFIFYWLLFVILGLVVAVSLSPENTGAFGALAIFIIAGAPLVAFFIVKSSTKRKADAAIELELRKEQESGEVERRRFIERERLLSEVEQHRAAITRNIVRAVKKNDYKRVTEDRSSEAITEFLYSISLDQTAFTLTEAEELVRDHIDTTATIDNEKGFDPSAIPIDGHEFERWVAVSLEMFGWQAEVTSASGDQGIDVIASKNGTKVGIQCKLYSSPVGNKAVQEAIAGKRYHGVNYVAVLSNAQFTQSAQDLATMNDVFLLSQHDIPELDSYI